MIKNIIEGHINELLGNKESIAGPRRKVCKLCPLYKINQFWGWAECNSHAWLNPEINDFKPEKKGVDYTKDGYKKGCGCRIEAKITVAAEKCPLGKW